MASLLAMSHRVVTSATARRRPFHSITVSMWRVTRRRWNATLRCFVNCRSPDHSESATKVWRRDQRAVIYLAGLVTAQSRRIYERWGIVPDEPQRPSLPLKTNASANWRSSQLRGGQFRICRRSTARRIAAEGKDLDRTIASAHLECADRDRVAAVRLRGLEGRAADQAVRLEFLVQLLRAAAPGSPCRHRACRSGAPRRRRCRLRPSP